MIRKQIKSSQIVSAGYDEKSLTLELEFSSGGIYSYAAVPLKVYESLLRAVSPGHYFAVDIRANYLCTRHHDNLCNRSLNQICEDPGCKCWCHRLTKSSEAHHGEAKDEKKVQEAKAPKKTKPPRTKTAA